MTALDPLETSGEEQAAPSLEPGENLDVSFPSAELPLGHYAVSCSTLLATDVHQDNDKNTKYYNVLPFRWNGPGDFEAVIYTRAGERVRKIERRLRGGDALLAQWDGLNDKGQRCAPGIYVCRLQFSPDAGAVQEQFFKLLVTTDFTGMVLTWR